MAEHSKGDKTVEQSKKDLEKARKQKEAEVAEKLEHDAANKVDEEKNKKLPIVASVPQARGIISGVNRVVSNIKFESYLTSLQW